MSSENPYDSSHADKSPRSRRPSHDPSVGNEPHLLGDGYERDATEDTANGRFRQGVSHESENDKVEHSVWDEPGLSRQLAGATPADALTYKRWLTRHIEGTSSQRTWWTTLLVAVAAGPWAILGALASQAQFWNGAVVVCLVAPLSEEVMKVAAIWWVVEKRPFLFSTAVQILVCAAISGLCFAAIENFLYLNVTFRDPEAWLVTWRWTVCVALHVGCTLIAGWGMSRVWRATMRTRSRPRVSLATPYLIAAIAIHAVYNTLATITQAWHEF